MDTRGCESAFAFREEIDSSITYPVKSRRWNVRLEIRQSEVIVQSASAGSNGYSLRNRAVLGFQSLKRLESVWLARMPVNIKNNDI